MNPSNSLHAVDLLDDVDHLLFLCDRLSNRLLQVNSYVEEVKQIWINKRRAIESDSNISPIIVQKVSKCNQVLLNVAEKLAIVELQTESLHNLQSSIQNLAPNNMEKNEASSVPSCLTNLSIRGSSSIQTASVRNETVNTGILSQRNLPSNTGGRSISDQQINFGIQGPLHVATNSSTNTFAPRNTAPLFQEKIPVKHQSPQVQSAFHRPPVGQKDTGNNNQQRGAALQNLLITQISDHQGAQKSIQNGTIHGYQQLSSNPTVPRSSDLHPSRTLSESNVINGKIRVKMQVIKANTTWHNADIPIIDHPSAFFVCNQDPRVAEQFSILSMEMNNYYNKPVNTSVPLKNPTIGDFCVARFSEDNLWYRARVVLIQEESILIVFIDYGNSESKPGNEIFPMQEILARLPAMTVACTLAESFPRNENFWTPEATQMFSLLVKNRIVEVQFQQGIGQQWPLHFVKVILNGQSIAQHPKLAPYLIPAQNEQIAMHFNDKLTSMEYILYNVAVVESDIYSDNSLDFLQLIDDNNSITVSIRQSYSNIGMETTELNTINQFQFNGMQDMLI
ncbi:unnamed protein product [Rotaria socialis]|uniref:Tudor domain-containing protein n=1 Tax=Rotaria socialis TaxID=392032 RepID=A0A820IFP2_9BILA|nr:unnamed protein product [Rotaria socialis]